MLLDAIRHWYLPLSFFFFFFFFFFLLLLLFLDIPFYASLIWHRMDKLVLLTVPCPSLMCSFSRGNTEGTNASKMCVRVF